MANADKNILITPQVGGTSNPTIVFTGADNNPVTLRVLDDGTLSIEGSSGQLFSVSDSLTGTIFSVNDISGIPSIEVLSDGTIKLAEFGGTVEIGTNTVWHAGNDGSGSGLDADLLDGLQLHTGRNNEANKVVRTDASGYLQTGWINTTSGATTTTIARIYASNDSFIRYVTPSTFRTQITDPYYVSKTNGTVTTASTSSNVVRNITMSTSAPTGGADGDVWMVYS